MINFAKLNYYHFLINVFFLGELAGFGLYSHQFISKSHPIVCHLTDRTISTYKIFGASLPPHILCLPNHFDTL